MLEGSGFKSKSFGLHRFRVEKSTLGNFKGSPPRRGHAKQNDDFREFAPRCGGGFNRGGEALNFCTLFFVLFRDHSAVFKP